MASEFDNRNLPFIEFTIQNPEADEDLRFGFAPSAVELLNLNTGAHDLLEVKAASGEVEPLAASTPGSIVNYDTNNGGSEEGTVQANTAGAGVTVKGGLAVYNETANAGNVVRVYARK